MEDIHSTFLATSILEMNSVNFGNKKGIRREIISKTNAVASNLCFKSFPKLQSILYIASRVLFSKISFLVFPSQKGIKKCAVPQKFSSLLNGGLERKQTRELIANNEKIKP